MAICCCSLAGTAACRTCFNNPDAEISPYKTYITNTYTYTPNTIEWDEFNPDITIQGNLVPTNIKCPKCGELVFKRTDIVLTSYPPKSIYTCKHCGWSDCKQLTSGLESGIIHNVGGNLNDT